MKILDSKFVQGFIKMANMEERLQAVVSQAETDGAKWHTIIHGNNTTTVPTENGNVPTVAKQMKDVHDEVVNGVIDYMTECQTARDVAIQTKNETIAVKNETNTIKGDVTTLRNETESLKNQSQTVFNNIATATSSAVQTVQIEGATQVTNVQNAVAEQVAEATSQANRAEQATSTKVNTNLSNITKETLFSKMFSKYVNGKTWYRVWPDGWIEQGGESAAGTSVTITFPKAFKDTNYTVVATTIGTNGEIYAQCIQRTSVSQMVIYNRGGSSSQAKSWYACGY